MSFVFDSKSTNYVFVKALFFILFSPVSLEFAIFATLLSELSMRRYIITLVFSLWLAHLFGDNPIQDTSLFSEKVCFPVTEAPVCFRSTIDGKDFLVFIEYSDSLNLKGHYMTLEESMTDTLPFRLEARDHNAVLYYNGVQESFHPHVVFMDSLHAEGYTLSDALDSTSFGSKSTKLQLFMIMETAAIAKHSLPWKKSATSHTPTPRGFGRRCPKKSLPLTKSPKSAMPSLNSLWTSISTFSAQKTTPYKSVR